MGGGICVHVSNADGVGACQGLCSIQRVEKIPAKRKHSHGMEGVFVWGELYEAVLQGCHMAIVFTAEQCSVNSTQPCGGGRGWGSACVRCWGCNAVPRSLSCKQKR